MALHVRLLYLLRLVQQGIGEKGYGRMEVCLERNLQYLVSSTRDLQGVRHTISQRQLLCALLCSGFRFRPSYPGNAADVSSSKIEASGVSTSVERSGNVCRKCATT